MKRWLLLVLAACAFPALNVLENLRAADAAPADLIIHNAKVVTVDDKFRIVEALAVRDGRVIALGKDEPVLKHRGPKTRVLDADGRTVLPGLYDSHVHPLGAATSELTEQLPNFKSLEDV